MAHCLSSFILYVQVYSQKSFDIEAPEYLSAEQELYVYLPLNKDEASVVLPVHVRYHRP